MLLQPLRFGIVLLTNMADLVELHKIDAVSVHDTGLLIKLVY